MEIVSRYRENQITPAHGAQHPVIGIPGVGRPSDYRVVGHRSPGSALRRAGYLSNQVAGQIGG